MKKIFYSEPFAVIKYFVRSKIDRDQIGYEYEVISDPHIPGRIVDEAEARAIIKTHGLQEHTFPKFGKVWDDGRFLERFRGAFAQREAADKTLRDTFRRQCEDNIRKQIFEKERKLALQLAHPCFVVYEMTKRLSPGQYTYMRLFNKETIEANFQKVINVFPHGQNRKYDAVQMDGFVKIIRIQ